MLQDDGIRTIWKPPYESEVPGEPPPPIHFRNLTAFNERGESVQQVYLITRLGTGQVLPLPGMALGGDECHLPLDTTFIIVYGNEWARGKEFQFLKTRRGNLLVTRVEWAAMYRNFY